MDQKELKGLLEQYKAGGLSEEDLLLRLREAPYEDLGYAKLDTSRGVRTGVPEVIYGAGKTPEQILGIVRAAVEKGQKTVLVTRMSEEAAEWIRESGGFLYREKMSVSSGKEAGRETVSDNASGEEASSGKTGAAAGKILFTYDKLSHLGLAGENPAPDGKGKIAVVTGGTSDLPVAEEAAETAEALGNEVLRIYDVGVAGIHRLFSKMDDLLSARVVITIAGMEGALTSVVAGLVDVPVLAVPTSVGYGASFHGLSALLSMLNSCASGVSVVNIDNGFGAAYQASMINHLS